jgi:Sulfotransferase family
MQNGWLGRTEERLIWIFGSSRSGSTWLLRMLSALDEVVPIDDPHLGHHLGVWRPIPLAWSASDWEDPELRTLLSLKREEPGFFFNDRYRDVWAPSLRRLIAERFEAQAEDAIAGGECRAGREPLVVVKEPGSQVADLLLSLFPGSRLVFLLRDGRDVVDSWLDAYQHDSWAVGEGAFPVSPEGRMDLVRWQATVWAFRTEIVLRAFEQHDPGRRVMVRYEKLLADPEVELGRLTDRLGVELPQSRLREICRAHSVEGLPSGAVGNGKAVRAARPGAWRENLTAAEQAAMHEIITPQLERVGYLDGRVAAAS